MLRVLNTSSFSRVRHVIAIGWDFGCHDLRAKLRHRLEAETNAGYLEIVLAVVADHYLDAIVLHGYLAPEVVTHILRPNHLPHHVLLIDPVWGGFRLERLLSNYHQIDGRLNVL